MGSHPVPHVVHAQLVGVEPHGGLQVVHVDQPQVALPQLPAAPLLHLETEQSRPLTDFGSPSRKLATLTRGRALAAYLRLVHLVVRLLPQLPVDVQIAVKHGRRAGAQPGQQQGPQHQI